jgi:hypothetical protein
MPGARARIENTATEAKRDALNALARDTGGFPLFNTNDLNLGLQRVLDDNETYYVLAYEPQISHRDGRFTRLRFAFPAAPSSGFVRGRATLPLLKRLPQSRRSQRAGAG